MECLNIHIVKNRKIDKKNIDEFVEGEEKNILYLIDLDSYMKKEMNLSVYEELSGIFELWIDAAPRRSYDVMDLLILGGNKVIIDSFFTKWKEIEKSLEVTENVMLKSYNIDDIEKFIDYGGKEVVTSLRLAPFINSRVYIIKGDKICKWTN